MWSASLVCLLLLAAQSAYLVWAGIGVNSFAARPFPATAPVTELQRLVGNNLLALDGTNKHDVTLWSGVGIYPEVNIGYGIRELAVHDPVIPPAYFRTWPDQAATANAGLGNNFFAPAVGSATRARYYGAPFILAAPGSVPKGAQLVAKLEVPLAGTLTLYRVRRSRAVLVRLRDQRSGDVGYANGQLELASRRPRPDHVRAHPAPHLLPRMACERGRAAAAGPRNWRAVRRVRHPDRHSYHLRELLARRADGGVRTGADRHRRPVDRLSLGRCVNPPRAVDLLADHD